MLAFAASPAIAQSYGQGGVPTVLASSATPTPGGALTLSVNGFCANTLVTFTIAGTVVGSATSDASGTATITTTAPTTPGAYTVEARSSANGTCAALVADLSITVPVAAAARPLPATGGSSTGATVRMGAISLFVGVGLFAVAKIRRRPRLTTG